MPKAIDGHGGCLPFLLPTFGYKRSDVIMDYTLFWSDFICVALSSTNLMDIQWSSSHSSLEHLMDLMIQLDIQMSKFVVNGKSTLGFFPPKKVVLLTWEAYSYLFAFCSIRNSQSLVNEGDIFLVPGFLHILLWIA